MRTTHRSHRPISSLGRRSGSAGAWFCGCVHLQCSARCLQTQGRSGAVCGARLAELGSDTSAPKVQEISEARLHALISDDIPSAVPESASCAPSSATRSIMFFLTTARTHDFIGFHETCAKLRWKIVLHPGHDGERRRRRSVHEEPANLPRG